MEHTWEQNNQVEPVKNQGAGVTLRYVVLSALNRVGDTSMHSYRQLMQIAIECLRDEMRMFNSVALEVFYGKVNEAGILQMPPDCLNWIKIGIELNGQLYNLAVNNEMVLNRGTMCGNDLRTMLKGSFGGFSPTDGFYYADHFAPSGRYLGGLYGVGGGFAAPVYRWDNTLKRFQINGSLINSEVIVEYSSTGIKPGTIIENELITPLRNYIIWQRIENDPRVGRNEKDSKERQYNESVERLRSYVNRFTLREFLDTKYRHVKQGIKR